MKSYKKILISSCGLALSVFLLTTTAHAQDSVDALQGSTPKSSQTIQQSDSNSRTETSTSESSEPVVDYKPDASKGQQILDDFKKSTPKPSKDKTLEEVNSITDEGRQESWGTAKGLMKPVVFFVMLITNCIWYVLTALYFLQTAIDVMCLVWSGARSLFARSDQDHAAQQQQGGGVSRVVGGLGNFVKSFFAVSLDFERTLQKQGMSTNAGTGNTAPQGGYGSYGAGGFGAGNVNVNVNTGNQGNASQGVGTTNLLLSYMWQRIVTLVALGFTIMLFASSRALDMQGDIVSTMWAIIQGIGNVLGHYLSQFFGW